MDGTKEKAMGRSKKVEGLTAQQERFCLEYVKHGNATEAYRTAFPNSKAKPEVLHNLASRLVNSGDVQVRIDSMREKVEKKTDMTIERWAQEVTRLSTVDPRKLSHEDGRPKMLHELDEDTAAAIASVEVGVDGIKYKFWPKNNALDMMAKHKGAYERDNKQKGEPINALAAAVLGGVIGVTFDQDDDDEGDDE
jgi:phage terminase small subunit